MEKERKGLDRRRGALPRRSCRPRGLFVRGIVALPLMLLISGVVLEMTIAATLIVFYLLQGSVGTRSAAEALTTAQSGINDALIQLARKTNFGSAYTVTIDSQHTAQVTVCNKGRKTTGCSALGGCDYTNASDMGKVEITALGTVKGRNRCVRVVYRIDTETGEIKLESSQEVAL
ncbi:MAG: hypothetical protein UY31_C0011G0006 [Candidatus Wolfebacteria bacterium GW2011_GWE1_48_7]|uniref:Uncharacterized protein n=2 Tax=Candidatus Wolfeibacteriota TaxID=1752735 RepID=A0A0G1U590_9BACT|nr:MAG: hypothetical protein UX70_C0001G1054 [Candidatus Wolfebacteria bacterium GW2011_GWB1_47_1]KKU35166.1 MAG: hypothetical protein UX49_C0029G0007 [Candidatus Wolfebacteria bacterium GW2011_GWC2_46_275]KKU41445.1 MAG: hypothetical protein UX58_C0008G0011 [Candidatus Wolfebacteria bacterium GW2011_GWB2_46_69]KKU53471.1 MAG: hypothetical protein UX76_C0015G0012 [Candidatus Wolfebacteria bacterium GW2011_GWC1_47_103]KKU58849.1 MAG: hypothetical protein UX83_C0011G0061 [Candidatus Wolfebacteria